MGEHTPFLTIFPGCEGLRAAAGGLDKAFVTDVQVDVQARTLSIAARFAAMPSPVELNALTACIRADYELQSVTVAPDYPRQSAAPAEPAAAPGAKKPTGSVLMGKAIKQRPVTMDTLTIESGRVERRIESIRPRSIPSRAADSSSICRASVCGPSVFCSSVSC